MKERVDLATGVTTYSFGMEILTARSLINGSFEKGCHGCVGMARMASVMANIAEGSRVWNAGTWCVS